MGVAEGEAERLGEQGPVAEAAPFGDVDDVEGLGSGAQPLQQGPGGCADPEERGDSVGAGRQRLEVDAEAGVEGARFGHPVGVGGVAVDVGDDHVVAPSGEHAGHVVVGGADAAVLDRAEDVRGGDADALRRRRPTLRLVQVRVELRKRSRRRPGCVGRENLRVGHRLPCCEV